MGLPSLPGDLYGRMGIAASASFTPAAAGYTAGDIIEGVKEFAWTFSDGTAIPPGSLIRVTTSIVKIDQTAVISSESSYTLHNYAAAVPGATLNDNDAWTLASAELANYRGSIALGTPADLGAACYIKTTAFAEDIRLAATATSTWGRLVTVGGPTFTAVARQILLYGFVI